MPEIPSETATKSPSEIVRERAAKRRRETWKRKKAEASEAEAARPTQRAPRLQGAAKKVRSNAKVSQATRDRLVSEALQSPAYEGMEPADVASFVNEKIDAYIANYPWWYGSLSTDRPKRERTEAQRMAFEKVRQRKAQIQEEVDAPYIP